MGIVWAREMHMGMVGHRFPLALGLLSGLFWLGGLGTKATNIIIILRPPVHAHLVILAISL